MHDDVRRNRYSVRRHELPEGLPTDVVEHRVARAGRQLTDIVDAEHVAMTQPAHGPRLEDEPAHEQRVLGQVRRQDLHRPPGLTVLVLREVELPGAVRAEASHDRQRPDLRADDRVRLASFNVQVVAQPHTHFSRPSGTRLYQLIALLQSTSTTVLLAILWF